MGVVGLVIIYFALMIFPLILKAFGLGVIADPLIKLINWMILAPFKLLRSLLR